MIGVNVGESDRVVVREFFELFKTPWEFYQPDNAYDVVVSTLEVPQDHNAKLVVSYTASQPTPRDEAEPGAAAEGSFVSFRSRRIPIYGRLATYSQRGQSFLTDPTQRCAGFLEKRGETFLAVVGYDLFHEIRHLLSVGQPSSNASVPTLDLHVALLRDLILGCGIKVVEIPPAPKGYSCIACLTHDVDHPMIRNHRWDHTAAGFLYRAIVGSVIECVSGRTSARRMFQNWVAAMKLPFIYMGLAKDFWHDFDDRYVTLENGLPSTFFVIPFRARPGKVGDKEAPRFRAAQYGAADIAAQIQNLSAHGAEIALHGIDAWRDSAEGMTEMNEIRRLTGASDIGVRMHWLYYDHNTPKVLDAAGAAYDSTVGYNETVGYRSGTTQVFKALNADTLLELPLHAMDTALFYPSHLGLSSSDATARLVRLVDNVVEHGGCLTVNWHDRSLAPERNWGDCYRSLLDELRRRDVWFATAGETVAWFRKRRSVVFEYDKMGGGGVRAVVSEQGAGHSPGLRLRIHTPRAGADVGQEADYVDLDLNVSAEAGIRSPARC